MQLWRIFCFYSLLCFCATTHATVNVIFINPGFDKQPSTDAQSTGEFWYKVSNIMQAAADDLNITLTTHFANRNHITMKALIADAIKSKPDYLILVDEKRVLSDYLTTLNTHDIPIYFLLNRPDKLKLSTLKQRNVHVIGSVVPRNQEAGKHLATLLYQQHSKINSGAMNLLALLGDYTTPAAIKRRAGLANFLAEHPDVTLVAEDVAHWSRQQSYTKTFAYLQTVPSINAIWCANDAIAFGAAHALNAQQRRDTAVVGGFNWDSAPVEDTYLDISMGGHVLLGAYALLAIYDATKKPQQFAIQHEDFTFFTQKKPMLQPLIEHINDGELGKINFLKFARSQANHLIFTVENLSKELKNTL